MKKRDLLKNCVLIKRWKHRLLWDACRKGKGERVGVLKKKKKVEPFVSLFFLSSTKERGGRMEDESHRWFWLMSDRRLLSSRKNLGYSCRRNRWLSSSIWFLLSKKANTSAKFSDLSVSEGIKKEPKQVHGEIFSFFTRRSFNVKSKVQTLSN